VSAKLRRWWPVWIIRAQGDAEQEHIGCNEQERDEEAHDFPEADGLLAALGQLATS